MSSSVRTCPPSFACMVHCPPDISSIPRSGDCSTSNTRGYVRLPPPQVSHAAVSPFAIKTTTGNSDSHPRLLISSRGRESEPSKPVSRTPSIRCGGGPVNVHQFNRDPYWQICIHPTINHRQMGPSIQHEKRRDTDSRNNPDRLKTPLHQTPGSSQKVICGFPSPRFAKRWQCTFLFPGALPDPLCGLQSLDAQCAQFFTGQASSPHADHPSFAFSVNTKPLGMPA